MWWLVKAHVFVTIFCSLTLAALEDACPYFPIEISRAAATSSLAGTALQAGVTLLPITLAATRTLEGLTLVVWVGLLIVAFVPDTVHRGMHRLGVAVVLLAILLHAWRNEKADGAAIACGIVLYGLRIVLKAAAIVWFDHETRFICLAAARSGELTHMAAAVGLRCIDVTFRGSAVFRDSRTWQQVAPVFQLCGVLQWVAFYAFSLAI
jgi:hypothetical protein